jgi:hypothetical protein
LDAQVDWFAEQHQGDAQNRSEEEANLYIILEIMKVLVKEAHKLVSIFQLMHEIVCSHYVKKECAKIIQKFQQIVDKNDLLE